jgi:hypothetical protein
VFIISSTVALISGVIALVMIARAKGRLSGIGEVLIGMLAPPVCYLFICEFLRWVMSEP